MLVPLCLSSLSFSFPLCYLFLCSIFYLLGYFFTLVSQFTNLFLGRINSALSLFLLLYFLLLIFLFDSFYIFLLIIINSFLCILQDTGYRIHYWSGWLKILGIYVLIFLLLLESVIQQVIFIVKWLSSLNILFCFVCSFFFFF